MAWGANLRGALVEAAVLRQSMKFALTASTKSQLPGSSSLLSSAVAWAILHFNKVNRKTVVFTSLHVRSQRRLGQGAPQQS
jgi:hypothetical protein